MASSASRSRRCDAVLTDEPKSDGRSRGHDDLSTADFSTAGLGGLGLSLLSFEAVGCGTATGDAAGAIYDLTTGLAFGQSKPADCKSRAPAPERVEGQVVNVDQAAGRVTVRDKSGTTHEFHANQETLQDMKKGDRIEVTLREAPKC